MAAVRNIRPSSLCEGVVGKQDLYRCRVSIEQFIRPLLPCGGMINVHAQFPNLPETIGGLAELAENLWWSWCPRARMLFKMLNRQVCETRAIL